MHQFTSALLIAGTLAPSMAAAQDDPAADWSTRKCALYQDAWRFAAETWGLDGIGEGFLTRHDAFLRFGCTSAHDVCPLSPAEVRLADRLTVLSMNEGMASTFVPFGCPD